MVAGGIFPVTLCTSRPRRGSLIASYASHCGRRFSTVLLIDRICVNSRWAGIADNEVRFNSSAHQRDVYRLRFPVNDVNMFDWAIQSNIHANLFP